MVNYPEELEQATVDLNPNYIFFPHWSWRVPQQLLGAHQCVCFHMTDVPFGRGGSPLQNLIARGYRDTVLTALRMVEELDAGPVYCKRALSLQGRAEDIYERAARLTYEIIDWMVETNPKPEPQAGEVVTFARRTPDQSRLPDSHDPNRIADHIRMLDAPTYPKAFVQHGPWRIELSHVDNDNGELVGRFRMRPERNNDQRN